MYKNPNSAVDVVVVDGDRLLLVRRGRDPFKGKWALPGGFVEYGESIEDAAVREVKEETGITVALEDILGVYSDPERDPRGHTVTVVFVGRPVEGDVVAGDDAAAAEWMDIHTLVHKELAFDHGLVVTDLNRWRQKRQTFWSGKKRV